ncbi:hypothetical protein S83_008728, partial [Arachis hypogaea]
VQEKKEIYTPYNILLLNSAGASLPIMQFEEIKAVVSALWNTQGFQRDNVRNQREHLILLLANSHIRLHPKPEPLNM